MMHPNETVQPTRTFAIHDNTWVATLNATLAVLEAGTPQGRCLSRRKLQRMAEIADLAFAAVATLERVITDAHVRGDDINQVIADARRLAATQQATGEQAQPVDLSKHNDQPAPTPSFGVLAKRLSGMDLHLTICRSARGWYIGTLCDAQPYTRESDEHWDDYSTAAQALQLGTWTQRVAP